MAYTKISDMKYERVTKEEAIATLEAVVSSVETASSADELLAARDA